MGTQTDDIRMARGEGSMDARGAVPTGSGAFPAVVVATREDAAADAGQRFLTRLRSTLDR